MDLKQIRNKIDGIDAQIINLLNNRMELALRTRKLKQEATDSNRESEVLQAVNKKSKVLVDPKFSEKLFTEILSESKKLQNQNKKLAGFQGEHGAYGEMAIKKYDDGLVPIPCDTFEEVFEGVENGQLDLGIVPVENSLGGSVSQVNELLIETNLKIIAECDLPVHLCLLAAPDGLPRYKDCVLPPSSAFAVPRIHCKEQARGKAVLQYCRSREHDCERAPCRCGSHR